MNAAISSLSAGLVLASFVSALPVQDTPAWPQFRGPGGLSAAPDEKLPLPFGPDDGLLWKTEVPAGHSSPCIFGDRIFLTGAEGDQLIMLALDRASGKLLWQQSVTSKAPEVYAHSDATPAQPTPCTDGEVVVFYFGQYGIVATDFDGEVQWAKEMRVPQTGFGTGTSPILAGGLLIVQRDGPPDGAVFAFDPATGEEFWSIPRLQFGSAFATPLFWSNDERDELIVAGSGKLNSYDLANGELLWEVGDLSALACPSPTGDAKMVYYAAWSTPNSSGEDRLTSFFGDFELADEERADSAKLFARLDKNSDGHVTSDELPPCRAKDAFDFVDESGNGSWELEEYAQVHDMPLAPGRNVAVAVRAGGSGDVTESHVAWTAKRGIPYVASSLLYRGRIYLVKAGGVLSCLDAATGKPHFDRERLDEGGEYYASPIGVGEHVVVCARPGTVYVLKASDELEIVHTAQLDDEIHATPAVVEGKLYLRTTGAMWAFGAKSP